MFDQSRLRSPIGITVALCIALSLIFALTGLGRQPAEAATPGAPVSHWKPSGSRLQVKRQKHAAAPRHVQLPESVRADRGKETDEDEVGNASQPTVVRAQTASPTVVARKASSASTASTSLAPPFTECPALGADTSCGILLDYRGDSTAILADGSQGPYDGSDDTLIGVINSSSKTLKALALESGRPIFGFDEDGLCAGYTPQPAGCPFGPTGYEGPGVSFDKINAAQTGGVVTFSGGLAPGATAYFSLEEPLDATTVFAGGPATTEQGGAAPSFERSTTCYTKLPINCATGAFIHEFTDLSVKGRGVPLELHRTYSSTNASVDGPLGYGWRADFEARLSVNSATHNVTFIDGSGASVTFVSKLDGTFAAAPWVQAALTTAGDGSYLLTQRPSQKQLAFDATGVLQTEKDKSGNATVFAYDGSGLLHTETDASGRALTFAWANGRLSRVTDPLGRSESFTYDSVGQLITAVNPLAQTWTFGYDNTHQLVGMTDPQGGSVTNTYDSDRRVIRQTDPAGLTTKWSYSGDPSSSEGSTTTMRDEHFDTTVYQYRDLELTSVTHAAGTAEAQMTSYAYDPVTLGHSMVVDPLGRVTTNSFDMDGNLVATTDPLGQSTYFNYDSHANLTALIRPSGAQYSYTYDANGNLVSAVDPTGSVTTYDHADDAHPEDITQVTDPDGRHTALTYNRYGLLDSRSTSPQDGQTNVTSFGYNADGEQICVALPAVTRGGTTCVDDAPPDQPGTTRMSYDSLGRQTKLIDPLGNTTTRAFDVLGDVTAKVDGRGGRSTYVYDPDGRLTGSTLPNGSKGRHASEQYDIEAGATECAADVAQASYCDAETDANGHRSTTYYNHAGQVAATDRVGSQLTRTQYDAVDNLTSLVRPSGTTETRTYDDSNRLTGVSYGDGNLENVAYTYNADGYRTSMVDATGTTTYTRDLMGRLTSVTNGHGSTVAYLYDLAGHTIDVTYPAGNHVQRAFDGSGQLTSVTDWQNHTSRFGYDADGSVSATTYGNGTTSATVYDLTDAMTSNDLRDAKGAVLASIAVSRDAERQVTSEADGGQVSGTQQYTLDANSQLTAANAQGFEYDVVGNPTKLGDLTQTFDALDELTTSKAGSATTTYAYNADGDRTAAASPTAQRDLTYGAAERLTTIKTVSAPTVTAIAPMSGPTAGGTVVHVTGSGFSADAAVHFGATTASATIQSPTSLTATAPAGTGSVDIYVTTRLGTSTVTAADKYTYVAPTNPLPTITRITPSSGPVAGKTKVTITGANLVKPTKVVFGSTPVAFTAVSATLITATSPAGKGVVDVRVTTSYGTSSLSSKDHFTYYASPKITKISPNQGSSAGGTKVAISGQNLTGATTIKFGAEAAKFVVDRTGKATVTSPPANPGTVDIRLTTPGGTTPTSKADQFKYVRSGQTKTQVKFAGTTTADAVAGSEEIGFTYDGDGLRMSKRTAADDTAFTYDVREQAAPVLLSDGKFDYIYGPNGLPIEQISSSGEASFFFHDATGSTRLLTDALGSVAASISYTAFGFVSQTGKATTRLLLGAGYQDAETGYYYLIHRYYDASTGTFLSLDPLLGLSGAAYSYASNNPVNFIDPFGLWDWDLTSVVLGGVSAVTGVVAVGLAVTGVGLPVAAVLEGVSIATGAAAAVIDCHKNADVQCGIDIAATAAGAAGGAFHVLGYLGKVAEGASKTVDLAASLQAIDLGIAGDSLAISNYLKEKHEDAPAC